MIVQMFIHLQMYKNLTRQSQYVHSSSLFLKVPVPIFFLAENQKGIFYSQFISPEKLNLLFYKCKSTNMSFTKRSKLKI